MEIEMTVVSCANCMTVFAIPKEMVARLRENHKAFCCPLGHSQSYLARTDLDIAKQRIDDLVRLVTEQEKQLRKARTRKSPAKQSASTPRRKAGDSKHGSTKTLKGGGKISRVTKP